MDFYSWNRSTIESIFSREGKRKIEEIKYFTGKSQCFITFEKKNEACIALLNLTETMIEKEKITISWAVMPDEEEDYCETKNLSYQNVFLQTSPFNCTVYCSGLQGIID